MQEGRSFLRSPRQCWFFDLRNKINRKSDVKNLLMIRCELSYFRFPLNWVRQIHSNATSRLRRSGARGQTAELRIYYLVTELVPSNLRRPRPCWRFATKLAFEWFSLSSRLTSPPGEVCKPMPCGHLGLCWEDDRAWNHLRDDTLSTCIFNTLSIRWIEWTESAWNESGSQTNGVNEFKRESNSMLWTFGNAPRAGRCYFTQLFIRRDNTTWKHNKLFIITVGLRALLISSFQSELRLGVFDSSCG